MKIKVFSRACGLLSGKLPAAELQAEVNQWFAANPNISVVEVKHDALTGFWSFSQIVISVYYKDGTN